MLIGAAKHVLLGGRTLDANDALRMGSVCDVVEPEALLAATDGVVDRMLTSSPALRLTKMPVDAPAAAHPQVDLLAQAVLFEDAETFERMTAYVNGKPVDER